MVEFCLFIVYNFALYFVFTYIVISDKFLTSCNIICLYLKKISYFFVCKEEKHI